MIQETLFTECPHSRVLAIPQHSGPHHAREVCADCHKFLRWLPKPETLKQRERDAEALTALAKLDCLNAWERRFVRKLITHKHISPRQRKDLEELSERYFPTGYL